MENRNGKIFLVNCLLLAMLLQSTLGILCYIGYSERRNPKRMEMSGCSACRIVVRYEVIPSSPTPFTYSPSSASGGASASSAASSSQSAGSSSAPSSSSAPVSRAASMQPPPPTLPPVVMEQPSEISYTCFTTATLARCERTCRYLRATVGPNELVGECRCCITDLCNSAPKNSSLAPPIGLLLATALLLSFGNHRHYL